MSADRRRRKKLLDLLPDDVYDRIARPRGDLNKKFFELIRSESGGFAAAAIVLNENVPALQLTWRQVSELVLGHTRDSEKANVPCRQS
jgi:hypothetical protein